MAMVEFTSQLKKWGNSEGILVPKKYAKKLSRGKIFVRIEDEENPLQQFTGTLKLDVSIDELMREVDEIWDE